jgi:hypothetical protein
LQILWFAKQQVCRFNDIPARCVFDCFGVFPCGGSGPVNVDWWTKNQRPGDASRPAVALSDEMAIRSRLTGPSPRFFDSKIPSCIL